MKLLLDTHLLLWAASAPDRLSMRAVSMIEDTGNELMFSPVSIWEVAIKRSLGRDDFRADPRLLRRGLVDNQYQELAVTSTHAIEVDNLPPIHKDPFDRFLIAQAIAEGITLVTVDEVVARYPAAILKV
jgi:PIN domain nuclease of toxin-antitoxin system